MPPKKAVPTPRKAPGGPVPKAQASSAAPRPRQEPLYPLVGKKKVEFNLLASSLDHELKRLYGQEMTISKFEKILIEVRGRADLKDKLYLTDEILKSHKDFVAARTAYQLEAADFRATYATTPVTVVPDVSSVDDLFSST